MYIKGDKSQKLYILWKANSEKLLTGAIIDKYKKAVLNWEEGINKYAAKLKIDNRIGKMEKKQAIIMLKNFKTYFRSKPKCRLINPTKNQVKRISKVILERLYKELRSILEKLPRWPLIGLII